MKQQTKFKETEIGKIPEDWEVKTIDEVKSNKKYAITMGPFGSNIKKENFVPFGVPVIRGSNLSVYKFLDEGFVFVTEEKADELKASNAVKGDIIITHRGTLGQVGIIPNNPKYARYIVSQSGMKLTCDSHLVDNEFVFYYLKSKRGQHELLKNKSQTGVPAIAQPSSSLKQTHIPIPELVEQHSIAKILSDLDTKIELLQKQNKTLEAIAQVLFKHWFIDFEFPNEEGKPYKSSGGEMVFNEELGKEISKGWEVKPIDEIANFLNGLALQKFPPESKDKYLPVIKIRELRQGITESSDKASLNIPKKYIIDDGDILFSWSGSLEVVIWCNGKGALNQHLFKVTSKGYPKWFYYYWINEFLPEYKRIAKGKATTMGHIQRHHLKDSLVVIPNGKIPANMDVVLSLLIEKIVQMKIESKTLSKIRDSLLPKLMSGKIRVPVEVE